MFGRKKRKSDPPVEPDLPITPMLDMSFQLMAFFLLTFRPAPTEAQISLALPKSEGGPAATALPDPLQDPDDEITVQVYAAPESGGVGRIIVAEKTGNVELGNDTGKLFAYLKERRGTAPKAPKLTFEMGDALNYQYVIKLLDEGKRAGYDRISPGLIDPPRKK